MNPLRGRRLGALGLSILGVAFLCVLCLRLTRWNATQAARVVVAMPIGTVFRTMALVLIPTAFLAAFVIGPWLGGAWLGMRYVAITKAPPVSRRPLTPARFRLNAIGGVIAATVVVMAVLRLAGNTRWSLLGIYATVALISLAGGIITEYALSDLPQPRGVAEVYRAIRTSPRRLVGALFGMTILVIALGFVVSPILHDPPGWLTWECMRINIPADQPKAYRYEDLTGVSTDVGERVYVVGEQHDRLVILDERNRFVYLIDKDWVTADRFCKAP
jgi:hypothetical protein